MKSKMVIFSVHMGTCGSACYVHSCCCKHVYTIYWFSQWSKWKGKKLLVHIMYIHDPITIFMHLHSHSCMIKVIDLTSSRIWQITTTSYPIRTSLPSTPKWHLRCLRDTKVQGRGMDISIVCLSYIPIHFDFTMQYECRCCTTGRNRPWLFIFLCIPRWDRNKQTTRTRDQNATDFPYEWATAVYHLHSSIIPFSHIHRHVLSMVSRFEQAADLDCFHWYEVSDDRCFYLLQWLHTSTTTPRSASHPWIPRYLQEFLCIRYCWLSVFRIMLTLSQNRRWTHRY